MPGFDGRGPMGEGARTGRGLGTCGTSPQDETRSFDEKRNLGGGGQGYGARRGRRNRFFSRERESALRQDKSFSESPSANKDIENLEAELKATQEVLRRLTERLDAMAPSEKEESES
jgi:hypothetical protein